MVFFTILVENFGWLYRRYFESKTTNLAGGVVFKEDVVAVLPTGYGKKLLVFHVCRVEPVISHQKLINSWVAKALRILTSFVKFPAFKVPLLKTDFSVYCVQIFRDSSFQKFIVG